MSTPRRSITVKQEPPPSPGDPVPRISSPTRRRAPAAINSSPTSLRPRRTKPVGIGTIIAPAPDAAPASKVAKTPAKAAPPTAAKTPSGKSTGSKATRKSSTDAKATPKTKVRKAVDEYAKHRAKIASEFPNLPENDALDAENLAEYKSLKTLADLLRKSNAKEEYRKFLAGALRASISMQLECPQCRKGLTSVSGIMYHVERCTINIKKATWEPMHEALDYEDMKTRFWRWCWATDSAKKSLVSSEISSKGSFACPLAEQCATAPMTAVADVVKHLDICCTPTYASFADHIEEFRALPKRDRAKLLRTGIQTRGSIPCHVCGKSFKHAFGIQYHLDRCGINAEDAGDIPWRCYRCGYEGCLAEKDDHYDVCTVPAGAAGERGRKQMLLSGAVTANSVIIGRLGDDLQPREASAGPILNQEGEVQDVALAQFERRTVTPGVRQQRRSRLLEYPNGYETPSPSASLMFTPRARATTTPGGKKRVRLRKNDAAQSLQTNPTELAEYRRAAAASWKAFHEKVEKFPACPSLLKKLSQETTALPVESALPPYISSLLTKESIGYRLRGVADFPPALTGKGSKTPGGTSTASGMFRTTLPAVSEHAEMPQGLGRLATFQETSLGSSTSMAYAGGPIAATALGPNEVETGVEVLAVLTFPDDGNLIGAQGTGGGAWRRADAFVQLWRVEKEWKRGEQHETTPKPKSAGSSASREADDEWQMSIALRPWCLLRIPGRGLALAVEWMPRPRPADDTTTAGMLAVATSDGTVSVYGLRSDLLPSPPSSNEAPRVVSPSPLVVLRRANDEELSAARRAAKSGVDDKRAEHARGRRSTANSAATATRQRVAEGGEGARASEVNPMDVTMASSVNESILDSTAMETDERSAQGTEIASMDSQEDNDDSQNGDESTPSKKKKDRSRGKREKALEILRERRVQVAEEAKLKEPKEEGSGSPPLPPIIALSWSPFEDAAEVAGCDAAGVVYSWYVEEGAAERGEKEGGGGDRRTEGDSPRVLGPIRIFVDPEWAGPATSVAWIAREQLCVAFGDKCVRILAIDTGECIMEEATVRTGGKMVCARPQLTGGIYIYQSEYYTSSEGPEMGIAYMEYSDVEDGYVIVPMTNRHALNTWCTDVSASGVLASAGCDGRLEISMNGKIIPRKSRSIVPYTVNLHEEPLLIIRNRVTPDEEGAVKDEKAVKREEKNDPLPPTYATHDAACGNMWIDIVVEGAEKVRPPDLKLACLDLRVESLNAVAISRGPPTDGGEGEEGGRRGSVVVTGGQAGLLFAQPVVLKPREKPPSGLLKGLGKDEGEARRSQTPAAKKRKGDGGGEAMEGGEAVEGPEGNK